MAMSGAAGARVAARLEWSVIRSQLETFDDTTLRAVLNVDSQNPRTREPESRRDPRHPSVLFRGASPLGLPDTRSRAPAGAGALRSRGSLAMLARTVKQLQGL